MKSHTYTLAAASEHHEQKTLKEWVDLNSGTYPELRALYAIPNGGHRHPATAVKMQAEGVKPGIPDLCLAVARGGYHALYIEMKRRVGGRVSDAQAEMALRLVHHGNAVRVCKGWEEAKDTLIAYLKGEEIKLNTPRND
jgi:dienelactone hydrolase